MFRVRIIGQAGEICNIIVNAKQAANLKRHYLRLGYIVKADRL